MYRDTLTSNDNSNILFLSRYIPSTINAQVLSTDTLVEHRWAELIESLTVTFI